MRKLYHESYMRRAIDLAANVPNLPFGAVIVDRESGVHFDLTWTPPINKNVMSFFSAVSNLNDSHRRGVF